MFQKYSIEVISHHKDFKNKTMRKYHVDGIDTIGVYGDESFEVVFKNHTGSKVQVKLSMDGTDLLTGDKANTEVSKDMWVVQAYGSLNLKAWPESQNGGAALVFTSANNSVAVHTHGDLSSRGIIAAAVFEEGHVAPPERFEKHIHHWYNPNYWWYSYPYNGNTFTLDLTQPIIINNSTFGNYSSQNSQAVIRGSGVSLNSAGTATMDSIQCNVSAYYSSNDATASSNSLQSLAAVGAGEYTEQKISYTSGLIKPVFAETVRVRYVWWSDLINKLEKASQAAYHASGFPGDKNRGINLGNTPRIKNDEAKLYLTNAQVYTRF